MRNLLLLLAISASIFQASSQTIIPIMDSVVFHDGYAGLVATYTPPAGVIKIKNDIASRKLTVNELASIGTTLQINVVLSALCDNYDRLGYVNLAFVPKGSSTYTANSVDHIELARFITPFMNKNIQPDTVPYIFEANNVTMILKDTAVTNNFDIWVELEVFGVPYAANTEVAGCSGRNDVFLGRLEFVTNTAAPSLNENLLLPLFYKNNFNNYQANGTDTVGKTTKEISFNVPYDLADASFLLITSNHGANQGGEEYNRRNHFVYYDGDIVLSYIPGRTTCEPFRQYNTQGNGIYGPSTRTDAQWQSFSNWCPGDVIDIRKIDLGAVAAGNHTFLINVPDATFNGGEGNIPLSLYFQGSTNGKVLSIEDKVKEEELVSVYPNPTSSNFTVKTLMLGATMIITDVFGKQVLSRVITKEVNNIDIDNSGIYFITIKSSNEVITEKVMVN